MVKKITDEEILEELLQNNKDLENPKDYTVQKDIAEKYNLSKQAINERFKKLRDKNLIVKDRKKTKYRRSTTFDRSTVYQVTKQGIKYGGLGTESSKSSVGPSKPTLSLADLHGDLSICFQVNHRPSPDPIEWDYTNELNNGVTQYIKKLDNGEDRITIELFSGKNTSKVVLKPRLKARDIEDPDDLIEQFKELAYSIRKDFERSGYSLGMGEQKGEGKFTLRSKQLQEIGYLEGDNILLDRSQDVTEAHPRTGSLEGNRAVSKALMNYKDPNLSILDDSDKIELMEEIGELGDLITTVKENRKILKTMADSAKTLANRQGDIAESVKELTEQITPDEKPKPSIPEEPGGNMYG